jgi:hypothetical protein
MGKCIKESYGEVDKSIGMIDYSIRNAEGFLRDLEIPPSKYSKATVVQQPWGPSLSKLFIIIIKVSCHGTFRFGFHSRSASLLWSEGTQSL